MTHRILAMGDNHGDAATLRRVAEETEGERFDAVVHTGDLTNTWYDGGDAGREQLDRMRDALETLDRRGPLLYVPGNRDRVRGTDDRVTPAVGTEVPRDAVETVSGLRFTRDPGRVDPDTVLVTHRLDPAYLEREAFPGRLYLSGHTHVGRRKNDAVNTAFLHRDDSNGAEPLDGGYFVVTLDGDGVTDVEPRLWNLSSATCRRHRDRGHQYAPATWRRDCSFCYSTEKYLDEVAAAATRLAALRADRTPETYRAPDTLPSIVATARDALGLDDDAAGKLATHLAD